CALTGYGFASRAEALECAEPIPGPSLHRIAAACAELGVFAVVGLLERDGERLFNACALVGPAGLVGSYRKVHLPFLGVDRFADPGDLPLAVHDAGGVRIGMHICYDGSFPETGRVLTLLGADLLVLPTNWPRHAECAAEHMIACRAMENVVYALAANRVGEEAGFRFIGRSSICGPSGERLAFASADREEILSAEIDPARARQKRQVRVPGLHEIDRIADRRPRFYAPLVEPNGRD
ncbi:MAG TPA: carbon-nitrogen hydrolase family protein, partial [Isosphaeraceae bacterium]